MSKGPEFGGAPAIRMYDEPKDLEHFLLALYDGLYVLSFIPVLSFSGLKPTNHSYFEQRRAIDFPILCGVLRLSIKYLVEHLRMECLKLLQHDWPMTLTGWDMRENESVNRDGVYESSVTRPHPIFIIKLAHELGSAGATLLPAAFYDLSRYNCSHIWTGCPATPQSAQGGTKHNMAPVLSRLSATDLQTVMLGKEAAQSFIVRFLRRELEGREVAMLCERRTHDDERECRSAFDDLAHEMYRGIVGVTCGRDSDPLFMLNAATIMQCREANGGIGVYPASRACEQCRAEFAQVVSAARRSVWNQLPRWFGLEDVLHGAESLKTR